MLYGIQLSSGAGFFDIGQTTGALGFIGNTGNPSTADLTSDLSSIIWTVDMTNASLLSIDSATGAVSSTTPLASGSGSPVTIVSLAWNPVTQILYGTSAMGFGGAVQDELYRINAATGVVTRIGAVGFNDVFALGFDIPASCTECRHRSC